MAGKKRGFPFIQSARALQENMRRAGPVAGASYTLTGAILLLGGLGYAWDEWADTRPWGLVIGLTLGIIVGFYGLIKTVWPR